MSTKQNWKTEDPEKWKAHKKLISRRFYERNPDYDTGKWQRENPEKAKEFKRQWRIRNRLKLNTNAREKWKKSKDSINARKRERRKHNPEEIRRAKERRRVAMTQAEYDPRGIPEFIGAVRRKRWVTCYYCGERTPGKTAHIDHVIPINPRNPQAERGAHTVGNLCVACPPCNLSKNDKKLREWAKHDQMFLL